MAILANSTRPLANNDCTYSWGAGAHAVRPGGWETAAKSSSGNPVQKRHDSASDRARRNVLPGSTSDMGSKQDTIIGCSLLLPGSIEEVGHSSLAMSPASSTTAMVQEIDTRRTLLLREMHRWGGNKVSTPRPCQLPRGADIWLASRLPCLVEARQPFERVESDCKI